MTAQPAPTPYQANMGKYLNAGWPSVLPLPAAMKYPPPQDTTGREATQPTHDQYVRWLSDPRHHNIALRLPDGIIGLDVDAYANKPGWHTLCTLEAQLGPLPDTWRSTSRNDGASGIRLYQTPTGLQWPGEAGPGIEIIQHNHRYMVVSPSTHPEGGTYHWIDPEGIATIGTAPNINDLPELPQTWVDHLTNNKPTTTRHTNTPDTTRTLLQALTPGDMCTQVLTTLQPLNDALDGHTGSRHETARTTILQLLNLGLRGHQGVHTALDTAQHSFTLIVGLDRGQQTAAHEWDRLITGGAALLDPNTPKEGCYGDDCTRHLPSLDLQPTDLTPPNTTEPATETEGDTPSWQPIDLHAIYTGDAKPEEPTLWTRTDGRALLYPGKVHSIYGESESGKSLLMQHETARQLQAGNRVLIIDLESDEHTTVDRLRRMGVTANQLTNLVYIRPERTWSVDIERPIREWLLTQTFTLAIIDGVTEALTLFGAETNDNDTITRFMRTFPRRIARATGAAVVLIDHTPKNAKNSRFAIGGQSKLAAIDGAAYLATVDHVLGIGKTGQLRLLITKDRPGRIRAHCHTDPNRKDRTQIAAIIPIDSNQPGTTRVEVLPPDGLDTDGLAKQRIWNIINAADNHTCTLTHLKTVLGIKGYGDATEQLNIRLKALEQSNHIRREKNAGKTDTLTVLKPYSVLTVLEIEPTQ